MTRISILLFIILPLFFAAGVSRAQISIGDEAPDFALPDTNANIISLNDFSGNITVINLFTTWCVPCQIEAPQLEDSIWQAYRDEGVAVIGVNFQESVEKISDFALEYGLTYVLLRDSAGQVFQDYGLRSFPSNIIIDQSGRVAWLEEGFNIPEMAAVIDSLLQVSSNGHGYDGKRIPMQFRLEGNFPNPFNNQTFIQFSASKTGQSAIRVYDQNGRIVISADVAVQAGLNRIPVRLEPAASGIYYYSVQFAGRVRHGRMILQK